MGRECVLVSLRLTFGNGKFACAVDKSLMTTTVVHLKPLTEAGTQVS